ncbi:MAG: fibronectin type III domain-containing protein, partial [Actinomycetales bacterium]|nr:fibronectin type III domain-containing protein [Actinomycetales bacterium]
SSFIKTKGAKLSRVFVQDSKGNPVTGGAITWRMTDNSAWSSKTYGLTADGIIDFPYAPAGAVDVTLSDGQMADGSLVSGSWSAVLGFDSTALVVPSSGGYASRKVHVQLPNGYPVANVEVTVTGDNLSTEASVDGFTFSIPTSATTGFTNSFGDFVVTGFWDGIPSVNTLYDDGIITQQQDNALSSAVTNVEFDYMPWVSFDTTQVTGDAGAPQVVQVSALDAGGSNFLGRHYATSSMSVKAGVAVTIVPPNGVKAGKCANGKPQKLSGVTGANGKAKLTICAYKSGVYTLKTAGAASVGSIRVFAKGAAPLAPTSVNVTSPVVGQLRVSWNKPLYDGGSPITQYTVAASAPGKPTVTKVIKATVSKKGVVTKAPATLQVLTSLSNATVYTVTVTSTTKNGTSDAYSVKVPVA